MAKYMALETTIHKTTVIAVLKLETGQKKTDKNTTKKNHIKTDTVIKHVITSNLNNNSTKGIMSL